MRLTLVVLFWLEGGLAEVWQATLLSLLSHSTAAKKTKYRKVFSQFACSLEHNISASCVILLRQTAPLTSDFRVKVVTSEFRTEGGDIA